MFEFLEQRRHLSVTAAEIHDTLYAWGDSNPNGISVEKSGSNLLVKEYKGAGIGYQTILAVAASSVNSIKVYGYNGSDTLSVSDAIALPSTIMGGKGWDWIKGGGGQNTLWGQGNWGTDPSGSHRASTDDNAADVLVAGAGPSTMHGQGGNDSFILDRAWISGKKDTAYGGKGNDTFNLNGTRELFVVGDEGGDTFKMGSSNPKATIMGAGGGDTIDYGNFGVPVRLYNDGVSKSGPRYQTDGPLNQRISVDVETMIGTPFNDNMNNYNPTGNAFGMAGDDTIFGGGVGRNMFDGGAGNDLLFGEDGDDTLLGQSGNDYIEGGKGNDILQGNAGNDTVNGGEGNDYILGGSGNDSVNGNKGGDSLFGESGNDWLYGESGTNLLVGGSGSDYLVSKNGNWSDTLFGDNQNGSGSSGSFDIAVIDAIFYQGQMRFDTMHGVESASV